MQRKNKSEHQHNKVVKPWNCDDWRHWVSFKTLTVPLSCTS